MRSVESRSRHVYASFGMPHVRIDIPPGGSRFQSPELAASAARHERGRCPRAHELPCSIKPRHIDQHSLREYLCCVFFPGMLNRGSWRLTCAYSGRECVYSWVGVVVSLCGAPT